MIAPRLRSPLALRIYLVGIAQLAVCLVGFVVLHQLYGIERAAPHRPSSTAGLTIIAFVLFVVGVSTWFLARSLTRPLRRLSRAATEFGSGKLDARAAWPSRDELGD